MKGIAFCSLIVGNEEFIATQACPSVYILSMANFYTIMVQLSSCKRNHMACKTL